MPRYKIILEYDGTDFAGWQFQPDERTVQGELERALTEFDEGKISLIGAGRTDAGVHAMSQTAHFDLKKELDTNEITAALNAKTPEDILVKSAAIVHPHFHARYDATWRKYLYVLANAPSVFELRYSWLPPFEYDYELLQSLTGEITGGRDFAGFCKSKSLKENTICFVSQASWTEKGKQRLFEIIADRFLHQMIRLIVGTMMDIARGRLNEDAVKHVFSSKDVAKCGTAAPPQGLFLAEVGY